MAELIFLRQHELVKGHTAPTGLVDRAFEKHCQQEKYLVDEVLLLIIIICSMHSTCGVLYCFGGVCAAASRILVVAIAKFGSYDKNRDK